MKAEKTNAAPESRMKFGFDMTGIVYQIEAQNCRLLAVTNFYETDMALHLRTMLEGQTRVIRGLTFHIAAAAEKQPEQDGWVFRPSFVTALPQNAAGEAALCRLCRLGNERYRMGQSRKVPEEVVAPCRKDLLLGSGREGSALWRLLAYRRVTPEAAARLTEDYDYFELLPPAVYAAAGSRAEREIGEDILAFLRLTAGKPCIASEAAGTLQKREELFAAFAFLPPPLVTRLLDTDPARLADQLG